MAFELAGKVTEIFNLQQVTDKFKKREFVIDAGGEWNGNYYENPLKFQCANAHCDALNGVKVGDQVKVLFGCKGGKYEKDGKVMFITNLNCFKIEVLKPAAIPVTHEQQMGSFNAQQGNYNNGGNNFNPSPETIDDLPF